MVKFLCISGLRRLFFVWRSKIKCYCYNSAYTTVGFAWIGIITISFVRWLCVRRCAVIYFTCFTFMTISYDFPHNFFFILLGSGGLFMLFFGVCWKKKRAILLPADWCRRHFVLVSLATSYAISIRWQALYEPIYSNCIRRLWLHKIRWIMTIG